MLLSNQPTWKRRGVSPSFPSGYCTERHRYDYLDQSSQTSYYHFHQLKISRLPLDVNLDFSISVPK